MFHSILDLAIASTLGLNNVLLSVGSVTMDFQEITQRSS